MMPHCIIQWLNPFTHKFLHTHSWWDTIIPLYWNIPFSPLNTWSRFICPSIQPTIPYSNGDGSSSITSSCQVNVKAPVSPPIDPTGRVCVCVVLDWNKKKKKKELSVCYDETFVYSCVSVHIQHLVHLEATVDVADKCKWGPEWHAAQHQREDHRREQRVAEELRALHQATHRGPVPVVKNRVDKDEEAGGAGAEHAPPPPSVVLARQQEVGERHRYAGAHREEDGEDAQQDAIEGVVLSAPNGGKDVVQLHWDGTEGGNWQKGWMSVWKWYFGV